MIRKLFRRKDVEDWEVVNSCYVDPVAPCHDHDDVDFVAVKDARVRRRYVLELKHISGKRHLQRAVIFARDQLLEELDKFGYNTLLAEGWSLTLLQKAKVHRIEVEYSGRPARSSSSIPHRPPPFMAVLQ